jgi:hypothetical protein
MQYICQQCGKAFLDSPSARRRFCSNACARQHQFGDIASRFWKRVNKTDTCWLWTGAQMAGGYGRLRISTTGHARAHRIAWIITYGPIPDNLLCCHKCDVRLCCRPDHLFLGTYKQNYDDCRDKGRLPDPRLRVRIGEDANQARLSNMDVQAIRDQFANGVSQRSLSRAFGVARRTIGRIVHGHTWRHLL